MVTVKYFKLPYVGPFSTLTQRRLRKLVKQSCFDLDIKLAFSSFKIRNMISVKDPVPFFISIRLSYINLLVQDVMLATSGKHSDTFRHAFVSIGEGTGPLTFSTIYKTLTNVKDSLHRVVFPF